MKNFRQLKLYKKKIKNRIDLFERGHKYEVIKIDNNFPDYITKNIDKFKEFIEN